MTKAQQTSIMSVDNLYDKAIVMAALSIDIHAKAFTNIMQENDYLILSFVKLSINSFTNALRPFCIMCYLKTLYK